MNLTIRFSSATQRWLLLHPNLLTRALLTLFYTVEVIVYSIQGARTFLTLTSLNEVYTNRKKK